jgi:hypothetical protein
MGRLAAHARATSESPTRAAEPQATRNIQSSNAAAVPRGCRKRPLTSLSATGPADLGRPLEPCDRFVAEPARQPAQAGSQLTFGVRLVELAEPNRDVAADDDWRPARLDDDHLHAACVAWRRDESELGSSSSSPSTGT